MRWRVSYRADPVGAQLADRHYSRQSPGHPQFMPAGSCAVFVSRCGRAVFGVSWPDFAAHEWRGAWINSIFRNEGAGLSSELILEAVAATRAVYGQPPALGMVTFVDASKLRDGQASGRQVGRCYIKAGFRPIGHTRKRHHLALQLLPADMPAPLAAIGAQSEIFAA